MLCSMVGSMEVNNFNIYLISELNIFFKNIHTLNTNISYTSKSKKCFDGI